MIYHDLRYSAAVRGDHRPAGRHAFDHHLTEWFADGRGVNNDLQLINRCLDVVHKSGELNSRLELQRTGKLFQFRFILEFGKQRCADNLNASVGELIEDHCRSLYINVLPFPRADAPDESDLDGVVWFRP